MGYAGLSTYDATAARLISSSRGSMAEAKTKTNASSASALAGSDELPGDAFGAQEVILGISDDQSGVLAVDHHTRIGQSCHCQSPSLSYKVTKATILRAAKGFTFVNPLRHSGCRDTDVY